MKMELGIEIKFIFQMEIKLLAPLAEDLLAAPASQAFVERIFSV